KEHGGKADALNIGLQLATGELVCVVDADTLIETDALLRLVRPFLMRRSVLAVGGIIRVVNGAVVRGGQVVLPRAPRRALAGFQVVEYLRGFLCGRLGWNLLGGNLIISGAFGLFRRQALIAIQGYAHDTVGEDIELVFRLRRHGYETQGPHQVIYVPDSVAWTEAPELLRVLSRQRERWHCGLSDTLWRHRRVLLNPRYGAMGLVGYPYFFFVEVLARTDGLGRDGASRLCHCGKYPAAIIAGWREPVMRGQRLWSRENRRLWWVPWAVVVCCLGLTYDTLGGICMSAETDIVVLP